MNYAISQEGIDALYRRECSPPDFQPALTAYLDTNANVWTIGCGITGPDVVQGMTITREQADKMFRQRMIPVVACINVNVKVPLTQNQGDALASFCWNVGTGAFQTSSLLKVLNAGKYERVPDEMRKWIHSGGKVNQGLVNRRNSEIGQWTRGAFVSSASVAVDPPPSWWQQMHNRLTGAGLTAIVGDLAADRITQAGHDLQALAPSWHGFAMVGLVLIVAGIVWRTLKSQ